MSKPRNAAIQYCSVDGCKLPTRKYTKCLCNTHYLRLIRYGSTSAFKSRKRGTTLGMGVSAFAGDVGKVQLSDGTHAIVDPCDLRLVCDHGWYKNNAGYAVARVQNKLVRMHRLILGVREGQTIDHINGDRLDNRRCNLRICTRSQNNMNKKKRDNTTSQYKGLYLASDGKWVARVSRDGKTVNLGRFPTQEAAALAYDIAAKTLHGDFAKTNDDLGLYTSA